MNANGRRCRQFANGFRHLGPLVRPRYPSTATRSVAESIAREKEVARRMMAAKGKKK